MKRQYKSIYKYGTLIFKTLELGLMKSNWLEWRNILLTKSVRIVPQQRLYSRLKI